MKLKSLLLLGLAFLTGCSAFSRATPTPLPTIALGNNAGGADSPAPQASSGEVVASGVLAPAQQAKIVFTLSGRLKTVAVAVGDVVQAGQALAELEGQETLEASLSAARFELEQAQQTLAALQKDLDVQQAQALKAIADSQTAVRDAERLLQNMNSSALPVDVDAAYANMILAKDRLEKARDNYEPYEKKAEDNPVRAALLSKLAQAQKAYDATVRMYNNLNGITNAVDLNQAQADLELAQAQLAKAQRDYEILKTGPDPDKVRLAEARRENAQNQLAAAQAALEQLVIAAPFTGTATEVNLQPGEWVIPGQPVVVLTDLAALRVETSDLSERDIPGVTVGQEVTVLIEALAQEVPGRVSAIAPLADTLGGDVVYKVTIELDSLPEGLRAGMSVEVQF